LGNPQINRGQKTFRALIREVRGRRNGDPMGDEKKVAVEGFKSKQEKAVRSEALKSGFFQEEMPRPQNRVFAPECNL